MTLNSARLARTLANASDTCGRFAYKQHSLHTELNSIHGSQTMAKPFFFDAEPVSRFAALDAGIRRPKVSNEFPRFASILTPVGDSTLFFR